MNRSGLRYAGTARSSPDFTGFATIHPVILGVIGTERIPFLSSQPVLTCDVNTSDISEIERNLLIEMQRTTSDRRYQKSVHILRNTIRAFEHWEDLMEYALCNRGDEHQTIENYYNALRRLVMRTAFVDGRGNFELPAGPRYTECRISDAGLTAFEPRGNTGD